jgi:hypothetical protein
MRDMMMKTAFKHCDMALQGISRCNEKFLNGNIFKLI